MPTYEYNCDKCGHFETVQRITEPPLEECPTCGGKVTRLISRNISILTKAPEFSSKDYSPSKIIEKAKKYQKETGTKIKGYGDIIDKL